MVSAEPDVLAHLTHPELRALQLACLERGESARAATIAATLREREGAWRDPEPLDVYDDSLVHRGVKERGLVHLEGDWHRSFHCWVFSPERRCLYVQRRAATKRTYPGALDTSVAGHYRAGETVREACREGQEELGLALAPDRLIPLGRSVEMARHGILLDREVADVFAYPVDLPLEAFGPDPGEVAGVIACAIEDAEALFCAGQPSIVGREYGPAGETDLVRIRAGDFTAHHDAYYARLALQLRRLIDGQPPLPI